MHVAEFQCTLGKPISWWVCSFTYTCFDHFPIWFSWLEHSLLWLIWIMPMYPIHKGIPCINDVMNREKTFSSIKLHNRTTKLGNESVTKLW